MSVSPASHLPVLLNARFKRLSLWRRPPQPFFTVFDVRTALPATPRNYVDGLGEQPTFGGTQGVQDADVD